MVVVIDSIMGSGKTTYMINRLNSEYDRLYVDGEYNPFVEHNRYMYVTPFLDEVRRIKDACPRLNFRDPAHKGGAKINHLAELIGRGENIVMTHALFQQITPELLCLVKKTKYTMILDEEMQCVDMDEPISSSDKRLLENDGLISVSPDGSIKWTDGDHGVYEGNFDEIRKRAKDRNLSFHGKSTVMSSLPIECIVNFEEFIILTYLYEASITSAYLSIHGISVVMMTLIDGRLVPMNGREHERDLKREFQGRIRIYDGSMNRIGDNSKYSGRPFSGGWFNRLKQEHWKQIKASTEHFFKSIARTKSDANAWTTFVGCRNKLKGQRYTKGFIPLNARATNVYAHKRSLAYLVNRYPNPVMVGYLRKHGVEWSQDLFALSEMLQWIWRSAIRNGEPISIFIPSERMRNLLIDWLNDDLVIERDETQPQKLAA